MTLRNLIFAFTLLPLAAHADDLRRDALAASLAPVDAASAVKAVKGNDVTPAKIELGQELFFDPRLSKSQLISCASCHNLSLGGADTGSTSVGHGWQKGPRRAPTVLNAVFNGAQFWDGRAEDLKAQAKGPVQASVEMSNTPAAVETTLRSMPGYVKNFGAAFPGEAQPVSFDNMAKAIEAFEATLVTPGARFDRFLAGNDAALNETEKKGLRLFLDKGCASCHNGPNLGGTAYFSFGVAKAPAEELRPASDKGRSAVTKNPSDDFVFRAAPLRNVALRAPYFHTGKVWALDEAVDLMAVHQLGTTLSADETREIVAFLETLTGEAPKVAYPTLPPRAKETPRPQY